MKIKITKELKISLLKAIQKGILDTEKIRELDGYSPARTLTKEEAKELLKELEDEY